ncbi:MAG: CHAD domain-containing protein [Candidatus Baltobacteraceae bacterium]
MRESVPRAGRYERQKHDENGQPRRSHVCHTFAGGGPKTPVETRANERSQRAIRRGGVVIGEDAQRTARFRTRAPALRAQANREAIARTSNDRPSFSLAVGRRGRARSLEANASPRQTHRRRDRRRSRRRDHPAAPPAQRRRGRTGARAPAARRSPRAGTAGDAARAQLPAAGKLRVLVSCSIAPMKPKRIALAGVSGVQEVIERVLDARLDEARALAGGLDRRNKQGLHDFRIACKRLRYALERFEVLEPWLQTAAERLAQLQDALGGVHDRDVLLAILPPPMKQTHLRLQNEREAHVDRAVALWQDACKLMEAGDSHRI